MSWKWPFSSTLPQISPHHLVSKQALKDQWILEIKGIPNVPLQPPPKGAMELQDLEIEALNLLPLASPLSEVLDFSS